MQAMEVVAAAPGMPDDMDEGGNTLIDELADEEGCEELLHSEDDDDDAEVSSEEAEAAAAAAKGTTRGRGKGGSGCGKACGAGHGKGEGEAAATAPREASRYVWVNVCARRYAQVSPY